MIPKFRAKKSKDDTVFDLDDEEYERRLDEQVTDEPGRTFRGNVTLHPIRPRVAGANPRKQRLINTFPSCPRYNPALAKGFVKCTLFKAALRAEALGRSYLKN